MNDRPLVLVGFALARQPGNGGHAWVALNWLLGLRRAGFDSLLVDRFPGERDADARGLAWVDSVLSPHGLEYCILDDTANAAAGLSRAVMLEKARHSVCLLNIMGYIDDAEILDAVPHRSFVDIDPGFVHLWFDLGLADPFAGHDSFATVGVNVGRPDCRVPTAGRQWLPTLPPVALDQWPVTTDPEHGVTTVATWRGIYGPIEHGGRVYGLRVHEFRRFLDLPRSTPLVLQPALSIDPEDSADRLALEEHGWRLADPAAVAGTPDAYRRWITASSAEICVAKQLYVDLGTGWFSDRSACYLAAGRPVLAQDTGFGTRIPAGEGLLAFGSPAEASAALDVIADSWDTQAKAARRLAEEHLDATVVLPDLLTRMEVCQ